MTEYDEVERQHRAALLADQPSTRAELLGVVFDALQTTWVEHLYTWDNADDLVRHLTAELESAGYQRIVPPEQGRVFDDHGAYTYSGVCDCGRTFDLFWNGGELDEHDCACGRTYWGEHALTVVMVKGGD